MTGAVERGGVPRRVPAYGPADVLPAWRGTPIADLLAYHNWEAPLHEYESAPLLVGMCMDHRKMLRLPERFAYVLRAGGANLQRVEFKVSFAIAIGGVRAIALIGHTDCGMVGLPARREAFVEGLVARAGWSAADAVAHFDAYAPLFEVGDAARFVCAEARRLAVRYPRIPVAPLLYDVADHRLDQLTDAPA